MTKWLEFDNRDGTIDRYKIDGITVDWFIDSVCREPFLGRFKDIPEEEYEYQKSHEITHNYDGKYLLEMYRYRHASKEDRNEYNRAIRTKKRNKSFVNFLKTGEL